MKFDIAGARGAGYSDAEIADFLAKDTGFDVAGAQKAGYTPAEIVSHLSTAKPKAREDFSASDPMGSGMSEIMAVAQPKRSSILEGVRLDEPKFDEAEAERLSNRAYAQSTPVPGSPRRPQPVLTSRTSTEATSAATERGAAMVDTAMPVRAAFKAVAGLAEGAGGLMRTAGDLTGIEQLARAGAETAKGANEFESAMGDQGPIDGFGPKSPLPYLGNMAEGAASSLGQSAALASMFGAGAVIPLMSVMTAGQEYDKARSKGLTPAMALAGAIPKGAFEAIGEKFSGLDKVAGAMGTLMTKGVTGEAKQEAARTLRNSGIKEIPGEVITYLGQTGTDLLPGIGLNPDLTMTQFIDGLRDTVVQAGMMGGAMGGAGVALRSSETAATPLTEPRNDVALPPPPAASITDITSAQTLDEAIAATQSVVNSSAAVDNIGIILSAQNKAPAQSIPASIAIENIAVSDPDIAEITRSLQQLENPDVSTSPALSGLPADAAGRGLPEPVDGMDSGIRADRVERPALDAGRGLVESARDPVPLADAGLAAELAQNPNVQNPPPSSPAEAQAAPVEAPAPAGSAGVGQAAAGPEAGAGALQADGLTVSFNGNTYPVDSLQDAQAKWNEFRKASDGGASEIGNGVQVIDGTGQIVASVTYNGRVWDALGKEIRFPSKDIAPADGADPRLVPVSQRELSAATPQQAQPGQIGAMYAQGDTPLTSSGRLTTPFPKVQGDTNRKSIATVKAVDGWLMQNALDEALSRGDEFNALQFRANLAKPQTADKDSAEEYLFGGNPPPVLKPLTRPLAGAPVAVALSERADTAEIPQDSPISQQQQASVAIKNVAPKFEFTARPDGTVLVSGNPAAIQAEFPGGVAKADGVLFGKSQAPAVIEALQAKAPDASLVAAKQELGGAKQELGDEPVRLGRNNMPLNEGGKPFKTNVAAREAKKLQPMMRVVRVEGGFALAEKSPAQLAAEARNARNLRNPRVSPAGEPIPAHAFIAAEGGLHADAKADMNLGNNPRIGNRTLFAGANRIGLTMEQATERLIEEGYLTEDASQNQAMALIKRSLNEPQYNPQGVERMAQKDADQREADFNAEQQEIAKAQEDEDNQFADLADDYEAAMRDVPAAAGQSDMDMESALRAAGLTEEEITYAITPGPAGAQSENQSIGSPAEVAAGPGAQSNSRRESAPGQDPRSRSESSQDLNQNPADAGFSDSGRPEALIELRKRKSVLESLRDCVGGA